MALVKTASTGKPVELNGLEEEKFELDLASTDTLISLLANMYARPAYSSLRELLQNAADAGPGTIKVSLPDALNPILVVEDSGVGMDGTEMRTWLKKVGASSKRGDATKAGNLGIGSLAPMSLADTMSIVSRKNGVSTTMNVWKNDAGDIRLAIEPSKPTSKPNGTTVSVPLHPEAHAQMREALQVFRFSPKLAKRIVVDGEPLVPFVSSIEKKVKVGEHEVSFRLVSGATTVLPGALVLMNGIPMGANLERFPELKDFSSFLESHEAAMGRRNYYSDTTMVIDIPPEAGLSFPPSRETIAVTRLNAAFLANSCKRYFEAGVDELKEKGLFAGCESAVLSCWKLEAMESKKTLREAMKKVESKLNAESDHFRIVLGFTYWSNQEIPLATLDVKIPRECEPRVLQASWQSSRRNMAYYYRLGTCELVPLDVDKPELGDKLPFVSTSKMRLIHWTEGLKAFADGWSGVLSRDLKAKQALFELCTDKSQGSYLDFECVNALLMSGPLPKGHPLVGRPNVELVDFAEYLESFVPCPKNPYLEKEDDEDEDEGPKSKGPKQRHPRTFQSASGETERLGLPLARPFQYIEVLRGTYVSDNWKGVPHVQRYGRENVFRDWMKFFEDAGIGSGYDAVELIPSEAKHIRREHVRLSEALTDDMEAWLGKLDEEERSWLPFGAYGAFLSKRCPGISKLFQALSDGHEANGTKAESKELEEFLRIRSKPPSDRTALFASAMKKALDSGSDAAEQFLYFMDRGVPAVKRQALASPGAETSSSFGFPKDELEKPIMALKKWLDTGTPLARFVRLLWTLHDQAGDQSRTASNDWLNVNTRNISTALRPEDVSRIAELIEKR